MNISLTFQSIADQFKSKSEYDKFIGECESHYDLKVYRVNTMTKQQACNYYKELKHKYDSGIYQSLSTSWYQNERRLFIWLLICYIKFSGIKSLDNDSNWEALSEVFFGKDLRLLKYQYMNILKKNGRVNWSEDEDQILIQAYNKYQKGQWNQVAKQLFFSDKSSQFKSPKHCRERWNNHLNTEIKKDPWNDEEDLQMLKLVKDLGKKWSQVAKKLNQKRTEHQIKNRFNSLTNHSEKGETEEQTIDGLISSYMKKKQSSKFTFFNNIIVVKQEQKSSAPIILKKSFEENDQKKEHVTSGGMSIIYCGKNNQTFDKSITTGIEERLFGSHFLSEIRSENCWLDRSILHTPGNHFLQDSSNFQRKQLNDNFKLSQKGSIQKSQFAASMEFFRLPRSDISQQYKILSSSSSEIKTGINYEFSNDIKQL